jgi:hypothetical protein
MSERAEPGLGFPVKLSKKLRVCIRESFGDPGETETTEFLLSQLDALEKNEIDIVRAVEDGPAGNLDVPERLKIPEERAEYLKSGVTLTTEARCFSYDTDFFEPLRYFADECDMEWMTHWNRTHSFLQVSVEDLEEVFGILEFMVKDST